MRAALIQIAVAALFATGTADQTTPSSHLRLSRIHTDLVLRANKNLQLRGGAFWFDAEASPNDKV
jgi:hypothetical protein